MKHKTIEDISKRMAGIDIAILTTHTQNGLIANRPMSNNSDVAYDGRTTRRSSRANDAASTTGDGDTK